MELPMTPPGSAVYDSYEQATESGRDSEDQWDRLVDDELEGYEQRVERRADMILADELEDFSRRRGLLTKHNPGPVQEDGSSCYGEEAMRTYPNFFRLLPQNPHYRGLFQVNMPEKIMRSICLSLWYNLVDLTSDALKTTCSTDPRDIDSMVSQARCLESYGFNVDHVLARLRQPMYRLRDLDTVKKDVVAAKKRKYEAVQKKLEVVGLEHEAEALAKDWWSRAEVLVRDLRTRARYFWDLESVICRKKAKLGSEDEQAMRMRMLGEEIEAAEAKLISVEQEVAYFGHHNNYDL